MNGRDNATRTEGTVQTTLELKLVLGDRWYVDHLSLGDPDRLSLGRSMELAPRRWHVRMDARHAPVDRSVLK
jgi:hypothetical protein